MLFLFINSLAQEPQAENAARTTRKKKVLQKQQLEQQKRDTQQEEAKDRAWSTASHRYSRNYVGLGKRYKQKTKFPVRAHGRRKGVRHF